MVSKQAVCILLECCLVLHCLLTDTVHYARIEVTWWKEAVAIFGCLCYFITIDIRYIPYYQHSIYLSSHEMASIKICGH